MKKIIQIFLSSAMFMMLLSCGQDLKEEINDMAVEYEAIKSELSVGESSLSISGEEQTATIHVSSNSYWNAKTTSKWLILENNSGKGNGTLSVRASSNPSPTTERQDAISVTDGMKTFAVTIIQAPGSENLTFGELNVYNITKTSANCEFTYNTSRLSVSRAGVCYSATATEPTTNDSHVDNATTKSSGTSKHSLTGLTQNTTYYARPYVTTSAGTAYGNTITFTTQKTNSPNEGDNPTPTY